MLIREKQVNCKVCLNYNACKSIETKYKHVILQHDGNWREVYENGRRVGTPIRRCANAVIEAHLSKFRNKNIIEIGCGPLSEINHSFCRQNNVRYVGLDPERLPLYYIPHTIGKSRQNRIFLSLLKLLHVKKLPKRNSHQRYILDRFPSALLEKNSFDLIYGNSTIEHWHEKEDNIDRSVELYREDINYCYDLLKPDGSLLINCPMYVHGNRIFIYGRVDLIKQLFSAKWKSIEFEHWREAYDDLMPYCPEKRKAAFRANYNIDLKNIWLLNIVATK